MSLTPLVNLPSPSDPANFASKADNFLTVQLPNLVTEWNTDITLFNNQDTRSTSTTSLLIGLGSKSLTVDTGKMYQPNMSIRIAHTSTANAFMEGLITSYNSTTGALVVNVLFVGSATGTLNSWNTFLVPLGLSGDNNSITSLTNLTGGISLATLPINFSTAGSTRLSITNAGLVSIVSGQLAFPTVQIPSSNPNVLDDYEEGTWTPSVTTSTAVVSSTAGNYTKIGNCVNFTIDIILSSGFFASSDRISIPFTCATSKLGSAVLFASTTTSIPDGVNAQAQTLIPFLISSASNLGVLQNGTVGSSTWRLKGAGMYFTN